MAPKLWWAVQEWTLESPQPALCPTQAECSRAQPGLVTKIPTYNIPGMKLKPHFLQRAMNLPKPSNLP